MVGSSHPRRFTTAWFAKAARKACITEADLCRGMSHVAHGLADDLGGGVFKRRLNRNLHRAIIIAKGKRHWTYVYLFAKKDRDNISDAELDGFRELAVRFELLTDERASQLLHNKDLIEICSGN